MLEEDAYEAPRVTQNVTPAEPKWDDLIKTDADAELSIRYIATIIKAMLHDYSSQY
jgi:hypothetical protein